ncbi:MAG: hypothetical protein M3401_13845, partial [Actinomycetota bacterium]|nr:hypothetical protein [Actinomycetota bacterium]
MTGVRSQSGSAMITAVVLMSLMLVIGLSAVALVDQQQKESGKQRHRESSLNLNEGVLYGQAFVLARNWPSASAGVGGAFPLSCDSTVNTTTQCPDRNVLAAANSSNPDLANFNITDFKAAASWLTKVRDNGGSLAATYDPAQAEVAQAGCPKTPCTLDYNNDRKLWVQVRTNVRGRPRSIVALLKLETFRESFPKSAITAGSLDISNQGNHGGHPLIDNGDSQIALRCDPDDGDSCVNYNSGQISNPSIERLPPSQTAAMTPPQLDRMKARAIADGTYFPGCPGNDLSGSVVWVENCPSYNGAASLTSVSCTLPYDPPRTDQCINTYEKPGILIWHKGTAKLRGNKTFVGLIYMVNDSDGSGGLDGDDDPVLSLGGGFSVFGAISVDGQGKLEIGSNAEPNVKYDANIFNALESYGT